MLNQAFRDNFSAQAGRVAANTLGVLVILVVTFVGVVLILNEAHVL